MFCEKYCTRDRKRDIAIAPNRPLALRGHVTNASLKQWVGILLMPKIVRAHKNYLTPEIWEETHLREIFYGTLIFQQSSMICIGRHVGGHTLALQHGISLRCQIVKMHLKLLEPRFNKSRQRYIHIYRERGGERERAIRMGTFVTKKGHFCTKNRGL